MAAQKEAELEELRKQEQKRIEEMSEDEFEALSPRSKQEVERKQLRFKREKMKRLVCILWDSNSLASDHKTDSTILSRSKSEIYF